MSTSAKKPTYDPVTSDRGTTNNNAAQMTPVPTGFPERGRSREPKSQRPNPRSRNESSATSPDPRNEADDCARLMEMLGTTDPDFAKGIYAQLINASSRGDGTYDAVALFFSFATMKAKKPNDHFQAMLVAQTGLTHVLTMKQASHLAQADILPIQDSAERAYNKLARTFLMQLEALNRLDTGGEQKVTVQNVSVSEGGQAIVGNVTQSTREDPVKKAPALTDARQVAMPILNTEACSPVPTKCDGNNDDPSST